jgi:uncharacterized protein (DUF1778 family)
MLARSAADSDSNAAVPGFGMVGSNKTRHRHDQGLRGAFGPGEATTLCSGDPDSERSAGLLAMPRPSMLLCRHGIMTSLSRGGVMARKPITIRLNDEEAELLEQAARIDAVSQNEFVRQAVLDRIAARKADPAFQAAVRRAVKANQRVFERLAQT